MIGEIFGLIQAGRNVADKIRAIEKYVSGKDFMNILAELDLGAAKESLERASVSNFPREHLLSSRNHLQSGIVKLRSKMDNVIHSRIAFLNAHGDLVDALYMHAILDLALIDYSSLSMTLTQISSLAAKGEKWAPREVTLSIYSDVFIEMPHMLIRRTFGETRKRETICPFCFCKEMRSYFYPILVEEKEVDFVQYENELYSKVKLSLDVTNIFEKPISLYFDGRLVKSHEDKSRSCAFTTSIGTHELIVICGNLPNSQRDRKSNLFFKLVFFDAGMYSISFSGKFQHGYRLNLTNQSS